MTSRAEKGAAILRVVVLVLGAAVIGATGLRLAGVAIAPARALPILGRVPEFAHVNQTGQTVRNTDLADKTWLAAFVYTTCPGPCPVLMGKLRRFQDDFASREGFAMVSFSVDPEHDTTEILAAYGAQHGVRPEVWSLLTGDHEAMIATIRNGFYLDASTSRELADKLGVEDAKKYIDPLHGPIVHSVRVVLVDRHGRIRGYYDSNDPQALVDLARHTERLLRRDE